MERETGCGYKKAKHILQQDQHYLGVSRNCYITKRVRSMFKSTKYIKQQEQCWPPAGMDDLDVQSDRNK